jgi:hypothetical protein
MKNNSLKIYLSTILKILNNRNMTTATKKAMISIILEENALILMATTTDKQTNSKILDYKRLYFIWANSRSGV